MSHHNKTFSLILLITMSILLSGGVTVFSAVSMENSLEADAATETIQSDDFDDCTLAPFWTHKQGQAGDPAPVLNGTQLLLTAPAGIVHDIWWNGVQANRILQPMEAGDFEVEVKFASSMDSLFQMQGIIVEDDDGKNALRFEIHRRLNGTDYEIFGASIIGADRTVPIKIYEEKNPMYMRVGRVGDTWTLSYSLDGKTWKSESFELAFDGTWTWIGLYAGNAEDGTTGEVPEHTAVFYYFYNMASPGLGGIDIPLLTTNTSGSGTITKEPDQATYDCNQEVLLTAVNDPGWEFSGWSGDLTGNDNPATIILDSRKSVTATFIDVRPRYTLTVNPVGNGTVTQEPDQETYLEGTEVTLTPVADAGWEFSGWSGDATGSDVPLVLTMDGDRAFTATFVEEKIEEFVFVPGIMAP